MLIRILSLLLSVAVFFIAGYFFWIDLKPLLELNYIIYMSLLMILMTISIIGILMSMPMIMKQRRKINKFFLRNDFSQKSKTSKYDY